VDGCGVVAYSCLIVKEKCQSRVRNQGGRRSVVIGEIPYRSANTNRFWYPPSI